MGTRRFEPGRRTVAQTVVLVFLGTVLSAAPVAPGPSIGAESPAGQPACVMPFRLVEDFLIVVDGSIADLGGLSFVVDTGTVRTVVDQGLTRALEGPVPPSRMEVFGMQVTAGLIQLPQLALGSLAVSGLPVLTADLAPLTERFGLELDAVLGLDVLGHGGLTIDYSGAVITLGGTNAGPAQARFDARSPYPLVDVMVNGDRYRLFVDSGSQAIALFEGAMPSGTRDRLTGDVRGSHIGASARFKRLATEAVSVGGHPIGAPPVFVMLDVDSRLGYDGVLGTRWLPGDRVHVDVRRRMLSWWPLETAGTSAVGRDHSPAIPPCRPSAS